MSHARWEVVKNTEFNTLKTKVNKLDTKISEATTLIHINQYNRDEKIKAEIGVVNKKIPNISGS